MTSYFVMFCIEPKLVAHVQVKEELSPRAEKEMILKVEESIKGNAAIKEVSVHFYFFTSSYHIVAINLSHSSQKLIKKNNNKN